MKQVTDTGAIEAAVDEIIAANPAQVEKAKANPKLAGWFVGQVMKATGGKANPKAVNELVSRKLGQCGDTSARPVNGTYGGWRATHPPGAKVRIPRRSLCRAARPPLGAETPRPFFFAQIPPPEASRPRRPRTARPARARPDIPCNPHRRGGPRSRLTRGARRSPRPARRNGRSYARVVYGGCTPACTGGDGSRSARTRCGRHAGARRVDVPRHVIPRDGIDMCRQGDRAIAAPGPGVGSARGMAAARGRADARTGGDPPRRRRDVSPRRHPAGTGPLGAGGETSGLSHPAGLAPCPRRPGQRNPVCRGRGGTGPAPSAQRRQGYRPRVRRGCPSKGAPVVHGDDRPWLAPRRAAAGFRSSHWFHWIPHADQRHRRATGHAPRGAAPRPPVCACASPAVARGRAAPPRALHPMSGPGDPARARGRVSSSA